MTGIALAERGGIALREQTRGGSLLFGTFLKTASHHIVEVLGYAGLDFLIIDAEHAPFDRSDVDRVLLAARSMSLPCLVRVQSASDYLIGVSLDLGASGVVVPHVATKQAAAAVVAAAKFRGARGFSPSTRAGAYGTRKPTEYLEQSDRAVSVWCQIEDASALEALEEIVSNEEVDCLFIGRADLALSLGVDDTSHPRVQAAVAAIADAGKRSGTAVAIHITDPTEVEELRALGISVYICGSDQSWLLQSARERRAEFVRESGNSREHK